MALFEGDFVDGITDELNERYDEISEMTYPEDALSEVADSWLPVYNGDIIQVWSKEMPSEWDNSWQEFGLPSQKVEEIDIVGLMRIDLFQWLSSLTNRIWDEIKEEKGEVA
jgi:hypothetical protein